MDIYKEKFTSLQREIINLLFVYPEKQFNQRQLAKKLGVSPTAIAKSLQFLVDEELIISDKDKETKRTIVKLNRDNLAIRGLKRAENLRLIYESGLSNFLSSNFALATIILFGSYSLGEDISNSDIDIAIEAKEKKLDLSKFEGMLKKRINLEFIDFKKISRELKDSLINGIVLNGYISIN